jgi:hypothetical protein
VFAEAGVFLGMVDTPTGLKILDIGSDYVLGVQYDDEDVEYIQVYDLIKGS